MYRQLAASFYSKVAASASNTIIKLDIAGINSGVTGKPSDVNRSCKIQMTGKIYFADGKRQINENLTTFTPDIILRARNGTPSSGLANVTGSIFQSNCSLDVIKLDVGVQDCIPLTYASDATKERLQLKAVTLCQTLWETEADLTVKFTPNESVPLTSFDYDAAARYQVKRINDYMLTHFGEMFIRLFIPSIEESSVTYTKTADGESISSAVFPLNGYFNVLKGSASSELLDSFSSDVSHLTFDTDAESPIGATGTFSVQSKNTSYVESHRLYAHDSSSFTCIAPLPVKQ